MAPKEEYKNLFTEFQSAVTEESKDEIHRKMKELADAFPEECQEAYDEMIDDTCAKAKAALARQKRRSLKDIIILQNIAQNYFHHTSGWLTQKMNGTVKSGKETQFSKDEIRVLKSALMDISDKLRDVAECL